MRLRSSERSEAMAHLGGDADTAPLQPQPLAGLATLFRFMVRRDRVRAPVWFVSIVAVVGASIASVVALYDTPRALQEYAAIARADPALKAIAGPGHGLDAPTLGAVVMNEILVYSLIAIALMCVFLMIRHTRAEEETDRAELVRAAAVGRLAALVAACCWVALVDIAVSIGLVLSLLAFGLTPAGSLAYGAAVAATGLVFVGVAAVAAQVASSARSANATAGVVLGTFFLLRAVGDLGTGWLTWLSPLGWAQSIRAFADERWWVLGILGAAAVGLLASAVVLSSRRDLGAGFFQQRPGPAEASPHLATPLALAARLQRTSLISWTVGLAIIGLFFGIVADEADQMLESEAIAEFFANAGIGTPTELFLATIVLMAALIASGYTVSTVLRLRAEEVAVRAEPVLAAPVARRRWLLSYFTVSAVGTAIVMGVAGVAVGSATALQLNDVGQVLPVLGASLAMVPALLVVASVAVALVGWLPKMAALAWAAVAGSFVVGLLAETLNLPMWSRNFSPFHHVPAMPAADFRLLPIVVLLAVSIVLTAFGVVGFERRDIG